MRFALVMHSPLGAAFYDCAKHILGQAPDLAIFDILPDTCPATDTDRIIAWAKQHSPAQPILILSDLYGATPFNVAAAAQKSISILGYQIELLAGANICMVMKALTEPTQDIKKLLDLTYNSAQRGIVKPEDL